MPNGDVIKAISLIGVWFALLGAYPSFRFEEIGPSGYFAVYLVGYFGALGIMIVVATKWAPLDAQWLDFCGSCDVVYPLL